MTTSSQPIQVTQSSIPSLDEYVAEIAPLWESHWLTNMGDKHKKLESDLKQKLQVSNVALYTNGHAGLECALEALELKGKVITTPFSFASTTHAIVRKKLEPVFADIGLDNYTIDPSEIEKLVDSDTCAIMPVHVYGNICDVEAIDTIARDHGLKVIYDAAHAFGITRDGVSVGAFGDLSMFSFHATKVFNTIEGGALTFSDNELKPRLDQWKNFGITGPESVEYIGGNAKMNEFSAAMGICNLRHFDREIQRRRIVAGRYYTNLSSVDGLKLNLPPSNVRHNYAYMPVVFDEKLGFDRNEVFGVLARNGIAARKYFSPLISEYACYRGRFDPRDTPVAKYVADRVLTLPIYADLSLDDVDRICDIIRSVGRDAALPRCPVM